MNGGGNINDAVQTTRGLLAFARRESLPVAHTRCVYAQDGADAGVFAQRNTRSLMFTETAACSQIVPELQPVVGELVVRKTVPSGFFLSPLAPWLVTPLKPCSIVLERHTHKNGGSTLRHIVNTNDMLDGWGFWG